MAEGFAKKTGGEDYEIFSAGSRPSGKLDTTAIAVMKEKGIDISGQKSKGFFDLPYKAFDYVVTMGCKDDCPFYPGKETIDWEIEDPKGKALSEYRSVRDEIENEVKKLLEDIRQSN